MGENEKDDGLKRLEYLSLVSKVCTELEAHIGCADKVLAEFITDLGEKSGTVEEFDAQLKENGAEMPEYFVRTLLTIIHAILPPKTKSDKDRTKGDPPAKFPGLLVPDNRLRVKELEKEIEKESRKDSDREDDRGRGEWRHEKNSRDGEKHRRREEGYGDDRRDRGRDRDRDRDKYGKDRDRDKDKYSRERDRDRYSRDRREENGDGRDDERSRGHRDKVDYRDERKQTNYNKEPELFGVYQGRVSRVMDTGCFVQLNDFRGKEGLVHISQIASRRVVNAKEAVKRDQEVWVKVISILGQKMSLSLRDVDQKTGEDLLPMKKSTDDDALRANPLSSNQPPTKRTGLSGITIVDEEENMPSRRPLKRMSSPEKWEAKQLVASGVLDVREYPMYDDDGDGMLYQDEGTAEEELEIELNEDEPAFLQGQTRYSIDVSPVKIVKNPDGSLQRAAMTQSVLSKERRELREQ